MLFRSAFCQPTIQEFNACAREYLDVQNYESAMDEYSKLLEFFPENTQTYYDLGATKLLLKKFDSALLDLNKAVEIDSLNVDNYY